MIFFVFYALGASAGFFASRSAVIKSDRETKQPPVLWREALVQARDNDAREKNFDEMNLPVCDDGYIFGWCKFIREDGYYGVKWLEGKK